MSIIQPNLKRGLYSVFRYLNAIQTMCPHVLRYLTTAVITNKVRRRTVLKDLIKVIQQVGTSFFRTFKKQNQLCMINFIVK